MKSITKSITTFLFLFISIHFALAQERIEITSPNKKLSALVTVTTEGRLSYAIDSDGIQVLNTSPLGITVDSIDLGHQAKITSKAIFSDIHESYNILGSHTVAKNHATEATIPIETAGKSFKLIVRVYNDGVAIRYTIPKGSKRINSESTSWNLPEQTTKIVWADFHQSYEGLSYTTTLENIPQDKPIMGPITFEVAGHYLSISEADCETFSDMSFMRSNHILKATFPFEKEGWDIKKRADNGPLVLDGTYKGDLVSPWRTTIVTHNITDLINSDLLTNLCPAPAKNMDFSWVQPGRCLWQWWSVGSPVYEDQKNWYDAAAKLKWEYYLVDDGWRTWKTPEKDQWALLAEVIAYGKSIGVKSIVWVNSNEMREGDKRRAYLERVKALGADGIKIDFIPDATSNIMQWYMGTMQDCAELKLLLNFHGSVKPTGLTRTYPNDITREAVRGNEYHMTRYRRVAPLELDVNLPFTRLMAGAADVTPVILDPKQLTSTKFTWPHEFAQAIVYLSPITHFTDQYKFYLESPMFDLFQEVPTVWDETKVLSCTSIGEVVAYARRKGDTWWIGVMNGATEREVKIPLDFLKKPKQATLIYDNNLSNTAIDRREQKVSKKDVLTVKLVPGGGFVARI
ncbi:glycoside hydrolase family 97 protein [Confluentibacter sediminis]|uniref:glycoside hydrolase family 97 protein n=1 Tax=Confluentibacter sediminis TaxID=2219045 RepID=UPI000DAE281F|nr:glycoside hydrolase family 97 protein [Confluentibacter sediminis]